MKEVRDRHGSGWFEAEREQGGSRAVEVSIRLARSSLVRRTTPRMSYA